MTSGASARWWASDRALTLLLSSSVVMAAEWQKLGDAYYRRTIQYELGWSVQRLDEFLVASSADMGWIALTRDPEQLVALGDTSAMEPKIQVYTGAGQLFETLPWDAHARIVGLGFTWRDELVVVADDGHVRLYSWLVPYHHPQQHSGGMSCIEATPTSYYLSLIHISEPTRPY